ncbi:MAG TPA: LOG family protein, partial [Pirellulales bacterium]
MNQIKRGSPDGSRRETDGEDAPAALAGPAPGFDPENALFSERPISTEAPGAEASAIMVRPDNPERSVQNERITDLVAQIKELADKLQSEGASRGDVKILSRTIRELRYAFKVFAPYRQQRKVTIFGSARTRPEHPDYQLAVEYGRMMAEKDWLIVTGAANGIMEAGHVGAGREKSMGLNIMLPFEQGANSVIAGDRKLVNMKYFFTRKLMFVKECHAVVLFPGGFGTLDEGFEVLTLLQTGKRDMIPVVMIEPPGRSYWRDFDDYIRRRLLGERLISPEDLSLYR